MLSYQKKIQNNSQRWSQGDLEYLQRCPTCSSCVSNSQHFSRRDDTLSLPDTWIMNKCNICSCIYLNPRPDAKSLPNAYKSYYTHQKKTDMKELTDNSFTTRLINGYLNFRFSMNRQKYNRLGAYLFTLLPPLRMKLDTYGRHIPKRMCNEKASLLDVGCGNGDFLIRAREMGIQVHGCEPDPVAAENCQRLGLDVYAGDIDAANYQENSFDYITLNHVIEHVYDPHKLLNSLLCTLKPGGTIWLGLPNPNAIGVHLFDSAWKGFHPPFHIIIPSQKTLTSWLKDAGFEDVKFIRRGLQSPGLWRESQQLALRENIKPPQYMISASRYLGNILASFVPYFCEETIVVAKRKGKTICPNL